MAEGDERRVPRPFIHAFDKLGFLLTEDNCHLFSDEDIAAWDAAVAEGEAIYGTVDEDRGRD